MNTETAPAENISRNERYHADKSHIGRSELQDFNELPWHYWNRNLNPERAPKQPTDAMKLGSLVHCLALEPGEFENEFAIKPLGLGRSKEDQAQKALFKSRNEGRDIVTLDQVRQAKWLKECIYSHPTARRLLETEGEAERGHFYNHPLTGTPCKIKPDKSTVEANGLLLDIKKVADASYYAFAKAAVNHWYHVQAAWYMDGYEASTGERPRGFVFILVEEETGLVAVRNAPGEMITLGRQIYEPILKDFEECRKLDQWPGYPEKIEPVNLPGWAFKNY